MERIEKTVFLSYRRTNFPWALNIFQDLTRHGYDVFFDYNEIASGDFESVILGNIKARAHFLIVLTPSALERCADPNDWLRREIETALDTERNVIPLMFESFDFGSPSIARQLVGTLEPLKRYNALSIPPEYFFEAMKRLRERFLSVPLNSVLHPASPTALRAAIQQRAAASDAPIVHEQELTAQQCFERGLDATDLNEKIRFYSKAILLKSDYAEAFNNRGVARYMKGDFEGGLEDYNQVVRLNPNHARGFNNRGLARHIRGDKEGALRDFDRAILLNASYAEALYNRGVARSLNGDSEGSLNDYNDAIRANPGHADALHNRGLICYDKGDLENALKDYNEAIRLDPKHFEAFNNRGRLKFEKGDLEGAIEDYSDAIRLKNDHAEALNNRGIARGIQGDREGALQDCNAAIDLDPTHAGAFNSRGYHRYGNGDLEGALRDYSEAIRLKNDYGNAFQNRAIARRAKNDLVGAASDLKEVERLRKSDSTGSVQRRARNAFIVFPEDSSP